MEIVLTTCFSIWLCIQLGILVFGFGALNMTLEENKESLGNYPELYQVVVYTLPWLVNKIWG